VEYFEAVKDFFELSGLKRPGSAPGHVPVIAEIGINHNGDIEIAIELMQLAKRAGCDAVKFQKRTPSLCVPLDQQSKVRDTPWGEMSYLAYKERIEFGSTEYAIVASEAKRLDMPWFASPWDVPSLEFLIAHGCTLIKIASASVTDQDLLRAVSESGLPVILSTGMSTLEEIDGAVSTLRDNPLILMHATSTYPCPPEEANLRCINTLRERYSLPVGYSGHEHGIQISIAAVALGAVAVERHITLNRAMWGTDQAASLGPRGIETLVRDIRVLESALGDGTKRIFPGEVEPRRRLRAK
jgi:N-acetylneuraminate synthase